MLISNIDLTISLVIVYETNAMRLLTKKYILMFLLFM